ncbi:hypothetical protein Pint_08500 [Pistacia integerrima]|uniref:Uncharacterized protein n=1 Tax=Pistacia integerrima TaxID=434235 RepID=A0ACC0Y088_9ROSI|nr:hypothetical protein Pint_08500 [Pistacia integerrima]
MSKMLFFAIMMNCLDPTLTLACTFDYRDPFTLPMLPNENKRATAAKFELASLYGGRVIASDHSTFESLEECKTEGSRSTVLFSIFRLFKHHEYATWYA